MTEWLNIGKWALAWGPGILILAGIYGLVKRPPVWIGEFIGAQQAQAVAMAKMASAVEDMSARSSKLDELLINDQVILRRLEELSRDLAAPRA